jgi:hypothetical protein
MSTIFGSRAGSAREADFDAVRWRDRHRPPHHGDPDRRESDGSGVRTIARWTLTRVRWPFVRRRSASTTGRHPRFPRGDRRADSRAEMLGVFDRARLRGTRPARLRLRPGGGRRDHRALPRGRARCGENLSLATASGTNGKRGAASVMRCSCRRGETFEGYSAGGKRANGRASSEVTPGSRRNPANPRSGTRLQHAWNPRCGGSRRGGAKPRGRNTMSWWPHDPSPGNGVEWTPAGTSEEGKPGEGESQGRKDPPEGGSGSAPGAPEVR